MIGIIIGFLIGTFMEISVMSLAAAAKLGDHYMENKFHVR